ncbi:MAG TPA: hypothetical protein VNN79_24505, partial [Actinomycetota bacterium]|nr:hypothetical protein [Actinomycetota bacterium]
MRSHPPAPLPDHPETEPSSDRLRRVLFALAGPGLIVAVVLVVQHRFAFGGMLTNQHPDILAMWLPTHCFLGASLQAGHVPAWNPDILGGTPFAADPQSGWMYLPAMLLSAALPCGAATRWFIVAQPLIAGLGMYAFLRSERLTRLAATAAGLVMALLIGGSYLGVQLPFAGAIAWTTVLLAATSRFLRTERGWPARLLWLLAAAGAWGQVASAHLSNGLVVGTFALSVYVAAALVPMVRSRALTGRQAAGLIGLLVLALPLVNLAVLVPRIAYLPGTTSSLGYTEEARRAAVLLGKPPPPTPIGVTSHASWPLTLIDPIGGYAGAVALAFVFGGWRRSKPLFIAFLGLASVCFVLSLEGTAQALSHLLAGTTIGDFYLHVPSRFSDGVVLAVPVLVGLGLQAFRDASTLRERLWIVAPGLALWWVVAPAIGILHNDVWLPLLAGAAGIALCVGAVRLRRSALWLALPVVIAAELTVNGLLGQAPSESLHGQIEIPAAELGIPPLRRPEVNVADYLRPGAIVDALRSGPPGRYSTIPPIKDHRGLIPYQQELYWPFLGNQRGVLFELESPDGVNPVQSVRHWTFVRATQKGHIYYNASFSRQLSPLARDLLQVNGVTIARTIGCKPKLVGGEAEVVAVEGLAALCRPHGPVPRASLVGSWVVASSEADALKRVTADGFDPSTTVVLEHAIGPSPSTPATGTVTEVSSGPQSAEFEVRSSGKAVLLVRQTFDEGWHATVDGNPAEVLAGDSVDQAVVVPAGHHVVRLGYDDPWIGRGFAGSALVVLGAAGTAAWLEARRRRRSSVASLDVGASDDDG